MKQYTDNIYYYEKADKMIIIGLYDQTIYAQVDDLNIIQLHITDKQTVEMINELVYLGEL